MAFFKNDDSSDFEPLAEINVTPMVDVMLVLLIIFMVAAPMLTGSIHVNLPKGTFQVPLKEDPVVLTFTLEKEVYLGSDKIEEQELSRHLEALTKKHVSKRLYLKADKGLSYGDVMGFMNKLNKLGYSFSLVSEVHTASTL